LNDSESLHDGKACAIYNREGLVRERHADRPGRLEIAHRYNFYTYPASLNPVPKLLRNISAITAVKQQPRFYQDVIGRDVIPRAMQDGLRPGIIMIPGNCGRKPD
jgi:hypothetical protein